MLSLKTRIIGLLVAAAAFIAIAPKGNLEWLTPNRAEAAASAPQFVKDKGKSVSDGEKFEIALREAEQLRRPDAIFAANEQSTFAGWQRIEHENVHLNERKHGTVTCWFIKVSVSYENPERWGRQFITNEDSIFKALDWLWRVMTRGALFSLKENKYCPAISDDVFFSSDISSRSIYEVASAYNVFDREDEVFSGTSSERKGKMWKARSAWLEGFLPELLGEKNELTRGEAQMLLEAFREEIEVAAKASGMECGLLEYVGGGWQFVPPPSEG